MDISENAQALGGERSMAKSTDLTASAQAQSVLAALVNFIQPIIESYTSSASTDHPVGVQAGHGREGQNLLNALQAFVAASARPQLRPHDKTSHVMDAPQAVTASSQVLPVVDSMPNEEIQSMIMSELRPLIYNTMPIRLLAFDAAGGGMALVERSDMFERVRQRAYAGAAEPAFRRAWARADRFPLNSQRLLELRATKQRLVADLVAHHSRYAILSHTWLRDVPGDVVFRDWAARADNAAGCAKIARFCAAAAREHGVGFGWVDSVCINKDSSTELDESIRSMYKWYRDAHVCITYLAETRGVENMRRDPWFTRGWTLQELLAPRKPGCFYNKDWIPFPRDGDAPAEAIQQEIYAATDITREELALCRRGDTEAIPVSRRLQLAARRQVTREEDTAYSLMGLLGVDITIAYGEGTERAFFRLVRELLSTKKNLLDVFNYGHDLGGSFAGASLVPASITQFTSRTPLFDTPRPSVASPRPLAEWKPIKPIILTHMGVRMPVLLVPALKTTGPGPYAPRGAYSGTVSLTHWVSKIMFFTDLFNLLDQRIWDADASDASGVLARSRSAPSKAAAPRIVSFGIMNFSMRAGKILLPPHCFSVALDCGATMPGNVHPSDNIRIIAAKEPPILQLKTAKGDNIILQNELERYGMQLITLYL